MTCQISPGSEAADNKIEIVRGLSCPSIKRDKTYIKILVEILLDRVVCPMLQWNS